MKRVLSGIQPTGKPHLGNYFGAIRQHIEMQKEYECYYMIADLHALTTVKDAETMYQNTINLTLDYLALGLQPEKTVFFRQSDVPAHTELCWIFDCITHIGFLERAHAWKDAQAKGKKEISMGLFNYPILQAADIMLYKPALVPVGQDQKQHVEMTRDLAEKFNQTFGEVFPMPDAFIKKEVAIVPGTDGEKMSKSYGNIIEMFAEEAVLKKQVMNIITDSTALEDPKDPDTCNVYKLYCLLATKAEQQELASKYRAGGFGYGDAKKTLLAKILEYFGEARAKRAELSQNTDYLHKVLIDGAKRANSLASQTLAEVKEKIGYKKL